MSRYFVHLREAANEVLDEVGKEFPHLSALEESVLADALELMSEDLKHKGILDLRSRIDVVDDAGAAVYSLPFKAAVQIIPDDECSAEAAAEEIIPPAGTGSF